MGIALSCGVAKGQTDATPATAYLQQAEKEAGVPVSDGNSSE